MIWSRILLGFIILFSILLYRAYVIFTPDKDIFEPCSSSMDNHSLQFDQERLRTFQTLLQFQTISYERGEQNFDQLKKCRDFIKKHYDDIPQKYAQFVQVHDIAEYSLIYSIRGRNASLKPFLFSSHMDVVPPGNLERWKYPPFDARTDEHLIYARGALDNK